MVKTDTYCTTATKASYNGKRLYKKKEIKFKTLPTNSMELKSSKMNKTGAREHIDCQRANIEILKAPMILVSIGT